MMNNNDIKIKINPQTQQDDISIIVNPQSQQDILIKTDLPVSIKSYKQLKDLPQINGITLEDNKTSEELGLQPAGDYALRSEIPIIPTDISAFNNDVGYLTEHQDISNLATKEELSNQQDKLIAGNGIDITDNIISNTQTSAEWGNIQGTLSNQTDLQTVLDNKQDIITDLETIREGASKGETALQAETDPVYTADKPNLATKTELQNGLDGKQDKGNYALKSEIPTVQTKTSE